MTTVRYSIKGISKAYGLKQIIVRKRLRRLKIKPKNKIGADDIPLYTEADVKAVAEYKKKKKKDKSDKEIKHGIRNKHR